MKNKYGLIAYFIALAVCLAGRIYDNELLDYFSKPLLLFLLGAYFFVQLKKVSSSLKKWILGALFFSWVGDILLMFEQKDEIFFMFGLASFLLAHVFYIVFFHFTRVNEKVRGNIWILVVVGLFYAGLIGWLGPYLGKLQLPVKIYAVVICFMLVLALHMAYIRFRQAAWMMVTGAILFVLSDSLLAINKFYKPITLAGVWIMLTYGLAQFYIVAGAIRYINVKHKE